MSRSKIASVDMIVCEKKTLQRATARFTQRSVPIMIMIVPFMGMIRASYAHGGLLRRRLGSEASNDSANCSQPVAVDEVQKIHFQPVHVDFPHPGSFRHGYDDDVNLVERNCIDAGNEYYGKVLDHANEIRISLEERIKRIQKMKRFNEKTYRRDMEAIISSELERIDCDRVAFDKFKIHDLVGDKKLMDELEYLDEWIAKVFQQRRRIWDKLLELLQGADNLVEEFIPKIPELQKLITESETAGNAYGKEYEKIQNLIIRENEQLAQDKVDLARMELDLEQYEIDRLKRELDDERRKFREALNKNPINNGTY